METTLQTNADTEDASVAVLCGADAYLLHEIVHFMLSDVQKKSLNHDSKQNNEQNARNFCFCELRKKET